MGHLNHVTRRGAVYVWRRRLPRGVTGKVDDFVQVSLKTKNLSTAKIVAVLVNLNFAAFISCVKSNRITRAEAQAFLAEIVSLELERIEEERYFESQATSPTQWRHRNLAERARAIALERVASMGQAAALFEDDKDELLTEGFSDVDFQRIESSITDCLVETEGSAFKGETASLAQRVLKDRGLSDFNLSVSSRIRLTGQAEAMKRSDRRQQTTPFVDLKSVAAPTQIIQSDQTIATPAPDSLSVSELRTTLPANVEQHNVDAHINDAAFAEKALEIFDEWRAQGVIKG